MTREAKAVINDKKNVVNEFCEYAERDWDKWEKVIGCKVKSIKHGYGIIDGLFSAKDFVIIIKFDDVEHRYELSDFVQNIVEIKLPENYKIDNANEGKNKKPIAKQIHEERIDDQNQAVVECRIKVVLTKKAKQQILSHNPDYDGDVDIEALLDDLIGGGRSYDSYVENAGLSRDGENVYKIIFATDTDCNANKKLIEILSGNTIFLTGINKESSFLVIDFRKMPAGVGRTAWYKISTSVKFDCKRYDINNYYEDEGIAGALPHEITAILEDSPSHNERKDIVEQRIKHWDAYLDIVETLAKENNYEIPYKGRKQGRDNNCITVFIDGAAQIAFSKMKRGDELRLIEDEDRFLKDKEKGYVQAAPLGTVDNYSVHDNTISIEFGTDIQERIDRGYDFELPEKGMLWHSEVGDIYQAQTLRNGLEDLLQGRAVNTGLENFLFDPEKARQKPECQHIKLDNRNLLLTTLNEEQRQSVEGVLNADDLYLIQGPPGTGKTTVIAEICYQVALQGGKTLIASQTNLAVDNAISRLVHHRLIRALRKGNPSRIETEGIEYTEDKVVEKWLKQTAESCKKKIKINHDRHQILLELDSRLPGIVKEYETRSNCLFQMKEVNLHVMERRDKKHEYESVLNMRKDIDELERIMLSIKSHNNYSAYNKKQAISEDGSALELYKGLKHAMRNHIRRRPGIIRRLFGLTGSWLLKTVDLLAQGRDVVEYAETRIKELNLLLDDSENNLKHLEKGIKSAEATIEAYNNQFPSDLLIKKNVNDLKQKDVKKYYLSLYMEELKKAKTETSILTEWVKRIEGADQDEYDKFKEIYIENANVIGITCGQCGSRKFRHDFDVVIVDEVSKATPPELLLPMLRGKKIVLVGDHKQLPPMIDEDLLADMAKKNNYSEGEIEHLEECLFKELFEKAPSNMKSMLRTQYRMHDVIMDCINQFYDDGLMSGLVNPDKERAHRCHGDLIESHNHALWVDTPIAPFAEEKKKHGKSSYNELEIKIICEILDKIANNFRKNRIGNEKKEVGIITFYRAQYHLLNERLKSIRQKHNDVLILRVGTVDRFQGMERPVVIVSLVRNNTRRDIGFAKKPERINVAFSRAQELLVIVGCSELFTKTATDRSHEGKPATKIYETIVRRIAKNKGLKNYDLEKFRIS